MTTDQQIRRGRWQLGLLALVFFGPLAVAIAMYFGGMGGSAGEAVNYGTLLRPPVTIDAKLHFDSGTRSRWTLLYKTDGDCDETCRKALIDIRQIRLATGREIDRIERYLISPNADANDLLKQHPGLIINNQLGETGIRMAAALDALSDRQIYIIDPLGNVILQYPTEPDRKEFLGDLKKLLKLSKIG